MKKIIVGTSDAWPTSRLFHRPSEPAYYIADCRISALLGSTAPAKYRFYAKLKVCMQARQGFGSSEFAHHGAACKIIDKLNPAGVAPVPSLWWWTMFQNLIFHNLIAVTGLGGLKKLQQTGYWEAASRILGSLKKREMRFVWRRRILAGLRIKYQNFVLFCDFLPNFVYIFDLVWL